MIISLPNLSYDKWLICVQIIQNSRLPRCLLFQVPLVLLGLPAFSVELVHEPDTKN